MEKIKRALEAMGIPIAAVENLIIVVEADRYDWLGDELEQISKKGLMPEIMLILVANLLSDALAGMKIVVENCKPCHHSGVYRDSYMPDGVGTKCRECDGRGWKVHTYSPFEGRALRDDIQTVCHAKKLEECPIRPEDGVPYEEFLAGVMPSEDGKAR